MKVPLFVYAWLKTEPPPTASDAAPAVVAGTIYDLGDDAALVPGVGTARGILLRVDYLELPKLDRSEGPQYVRTVVMARTEAGARPAYAYVRAGKIPDSAPAVEEWKPK